MTEILLKLLKEISLNVVQEISLNLIAFDRNSTKTFTEFPSKSDRYIAKTLREILLKV